ncbi:MAG TPA: serine/threonine-protein kinase [Gemmataceae bacterium]|jgi:serine/threonine-protein kinase
MSAHAPSPSTADRNLLFGILALQMDFINRDALVAAMNAWVLQKTIPLGQILLDQGAIHADTRALLDALVRKHLEMHGGDAQKSLAAVCPLDAVRQHLEQIADPDVYATLGNISGTRDGGEADPFATRASAPGDTAQPSLRFRILRPHARGGLGEVFVARDEELHREVALKEIQGRYAADLNSRARFLLEAEVTGGLEHPGIVPVYGLGVYADGRPYYAMRFIQGDSLQQTIARFHSAEKSNRDPGERTLALRQLLGRFVDVCSAIAYAHSRGVLHRDLKPSNIMLGSYGETLVVDWGLAKTLGERMEPANGTTAERTLKPTLSDSALPTQVGSAMGTPAYMPPEQAAGQLDRLGPASDVYSLGATLYCLLTGKPPFEGVEVGEILQRVQCGDFPSPRAVKPEVPAALEAVCRKAMALRPEDRYASPRALAADVERWLADEPVSAWREPWRLRVGRWSRRHRTLVATAATAMLLTVLAALAGAWWLDRERAEQRHAIEGALEDVADLQAQSRWDEARAVLGQARHRLGGGDPQDLHHKLERAQANLDLVARLDEVRLRRAAVVNGHLDTAGADHHFEQAFREAGLGEVGSDTAVAVAWVRASGVHDTLVAALDVWAACAHEKQRHAWLVDVARQVVSDPWRDRLQDPRHGTTPAS